MALLVASGFPNAHRDLGSVLQNEQETVGIRVLAAAHLGRIGAHAAVEILIRNSHIRDERILAVIMTALGRIGDRSALDLVLNVKEQATGLPPTLTITWSCRMAPPFQSTLRELITTTPRIACARSGPGRSASNSMSAPCIPFADGTASQWFYSTGT
jgi:hypothetical protein